MSPSLIYKTLLLHLYILGKIKNYFKWKGQISHCVSNLSDRLLYGITNHDFNKLQFVQTVASQKKGFDP